MSQFSDQLLAWYDANKRNLPWRKTKDPYAIWISEIMLQQTRVETVIPYYERFLRRLPTIESLADVEENELLKLWEGLGYYTRALNLQKAAIKIKNDFHGVFPIQLEAIQSLPGIGPYTACAIASIAFDQRVIAIDGNVIRVFSRYFALPLDPTKNPTKKVVETKTDSLIPSKRNGDFTQSLMELGATICLPNGKPKCESCPLAHSCQAYLTNTIELYPLKGKNSIRKVEKWTVILLVNEQGQVWIRKRPNHGLLKGLWEFMMVEGHLNDKEIQLYLTQNNIPFTTIQSLSTAKHIFSHIEWDMKGFLINIQNDPIPLGGQFVDTTQLFDHYAIATALQAFKQFIKPNRL